MSAVRVDGEIRPDILHAAAYNTCFAVWLSKVETLCERFLDLSFVEHLDAGLDAFEAYDVGIPPEQFFVELVCPYVENEQGCDFLDEYIAQAAMWGASEWP